MKRFFAGIILLLALILDGCAGSKPEGRGFAVWVDIETSQEIYGISYEYTTGGEMLGSGAIVNADGTRMRAGESVMLQFLPEDFPKGKIPEGFQVRIFLSDHRGNEIGASFPVTVCTLLDDDCRFCLTGSDPEGYLLTRTG